MSWHSSLSTFGRLDEQVPMSAHTTLAIGGPARWYFRPADRDSLARAVQLIPADVRILPLGRGSNLLIPDEGFDGIVVDFGDLSAITFDGNRLSTEAGARMSKVAQQCAAHGLTGLEFLATVPGDMGGGVAMNAGAFGQQLSDTLLEIEVVLPGGDRQTIGRANLAMAYRHTALPAGALVVAASFELGTGDSESIRDRMRQMRRQRSQTQPLSMPNCGSVFKNPEGDHAARLIEAAGLKGKQIGAARISGTHANFIVNEGKASSQDVMALISMAQQAVEEKFGIRLEPEVRILGGET